MLIDHDDYTCSSLVETGLYVSSYFTGSRSHAETQFTLRTTMSIVFLSILVCISSLLNNLSPPFLLMSQYQTVE
jgi:hypothetical protein